MVYDRVLASPQILIFFLRANIVKAYDTRSRLVKLIGLLVLRKVSVDGSFMKSVPRKEGFFLFLAVCAAFDAVE